MQHVKIYYPPSPPPPRISTFILYHAYENSEITSKWVELRYKTPSLPYYICADRFLKPKKINIKNKLKFSPFIGW